MMTSSAKNQYITPSEQLENIGEELLHSLDLAKQIPRFESGELDQYHNYISNIGSSIKSGLLKTAVIGVIKSGKSTLINSLLKKDVVKRGAGVMTAITTRIRKGNKNKACLTFKSWDDVNDEISKAIAFFPNDDDKGELDRPFDLRRKNDRQRLKQIHDNLDKHLRTSSIQIQPELLLVQHALNGFEVCSDFIEADETLHQFTGKDFDGHKRFTANPNNAFFLKDVCLEVYGNGLVPNLEIADCQGADSTDPAQLERVMDYIESSNLILYCISSRTGLRQSDVVLIRRLEKIGRLDQVLFVNNCDLSEHENQADLKRIKSGILNDLAQLNIINPTLYSFSALYNLFASLKRIRSRDRDRLNLWQKDKAITNYCNDQSIQFEKDYQQLIEDERNAILISSHFEKMGSICRWMNERADLFNDLLSADQKTEKKAEKKIQVHFDNIRRLNSVMSHSLKKTSKDLKYQVDKDLNEYFRSDGKELLEKTQAFIDTIRLDVNQYRSVVGNTGFKHILYLMFQDFKKQLELYTVEQVQPSLKAFVKSEEKKIKAYLQSMIESYRIEIYTEDIESLVKTQNNSSNGHDHAILDEIDLSGIKLLLGLSIPGPVFTPTYSPSLKANIFSGFFFKTLAEIIAGAFRKQKQFSFSPILDKTARSMRIQNQRTIKKQFTDFQEQLAKDYLLPLVEAGLRESEKCIEKRFDAYQQQNERLRQVIELNDTDKSKQRRLILKLKDQSQKILDEIRAIQISCNFTFRKTQK